MPATYRAGASIRIFDVVTHRVTLAAEYKRKVFIYGRGGYRFGYDEEGLTLGAGVLFPSSSESEVRVDYAYVDMGNLDYVQRIGVALFF